ncbi:serine/threonine-protein kinase TNNI3K-like [Strongylocentrotus purpuratus]|uniref:ZU5 domain-containing protein n=1 Tax=Strongylocentrotus purpuratus TaxID=7668 RepID=A0A7M7P399_STRPU|nr:serine/threonine-protein kinase TNNI3K-like [Strongylocentrotus purpuratus]
MALFSAAAKGDFLKIQSLIDSEDKSEDSGGVDVNCSDKSGQTLLHIASENGHLQTVKCLTHHGAKVNVVDANLQTSVHLCSMKGHLHVVELLANEGADLDVGDKDGFTALHIASVEGHLEVVQYIVNKGAGIEIGDKYGITALHIASLKGHLAIVKYLVRKGADPGKLANEEDHYDYLRSIFGSGALPSYMPPYSRTYDPYLTSPQDISRSSRKSIREETMIISLDEYSIKVLLSPEDVDRAKYITAEALTTVPHDLNLEKDEVIISVGLKLSPPGLQFKTPVEVTVSHSAIFTNPDKAEIMLYTRRTESDEFARIVPASDKAARCVVANNHLTLYLDHFSEWWIISLIRRYFIGKRLICTPYVPLSTSRDVMNYILLNIKDDICGMKEVDLS